MTDFLIGFLLSMLVGVAAFQKQSLDESGVITALIIGTLLYGFVGWFAFLMLMFFFISSSLMSKFNPDKKSSKRTYIQVLANGGLVGILAILYGLTGEPKMIYVLILTSIAVATSDTWSSEIGRMSKNLPKLIFTKKEVPKGISGGVTLLGFSASLSASLIFALLSLFVVEWIDALFIFIFAFAGGIFDSVLGIIQVKYKDVKENILTEKISITTVYHSGYRWLDNNLVNFLSNSLAVLILYTIYLIL